MVRQETVELPKTEGRSVSKLSTRELVLPKALTGLRQSGQLKIALEVLTVVLALQTTDQELRIIVQTPT